MAIDEDGGTEAWGRRSQVRLEELPDVDPIAYLGTKRHPVSIPPTTRDVEPSALAGADAAGKSHATRRVLATVVGFSIALPMVISLSSGDDVVGVPATRASAGLAAASAEPGRESAPRDLPPGGVTDGMVLPESAVPLQSSDDVAENASPVPGGTANDGVAPDSPRTESPELRGAGAGHERAVSRESSGADDAANAPAVLISRASVPDRGPASKRGSAVNAFPTPFDFGAAMDAVARTPVGPEQCGPEAVGAASVAIRFSPSGHATRAVVESGPLRGTEAGSCVARELGKVRIAPFDGDAATVRTSIRLR